MISEKELENLANLARINLPAGERQSLVKDVGAILDYVDQLKEVHPVRNQTPEASADAPAHRTSNGVSILRDDVSPHSAGAYTSELLAAARTKDGYFKVKQIFADEQ